MYLHSESVNIGIVAVVFNDAYDGKVVRET